MEAAESWKEAFRVLKIGCKNTIALPFTSVLGLPGLPRDRAKQCLCLVLVLCFALILLVWVVLVVVLVLLGVVLEQVEVVASHHCYRC